MKRWKIRALHNGLGVAVGSLEEVADTTVANGAEVAASLRVAIMRCASHTRPGPKNR